MNASQIIDALLAHTSIRRFTDQAIDPSLLQRLIRAGQAASTSSYIQAVSVVRVSDGSSRRSLAELAGGQSYVENCAEFLVFCADLQRNQQRVQQQSGSDPEYAWVEQFVAATVDTALFAQNVVAAAEVSGLGACYIGGIRNNPEKVTAVLNLPDLVFPVFGLCLGYPDQKPEPKPRLPLEVVLHQETYKLAESEHAQIDQYDALVKAYYERRSRGRLSQTWSEQMAKQAASQKREFMKKYLQKQGFIKF